MDLVRRSSKRGRLYRRCRVVVEDGDGEFVAAQIFPDVLDRIEFRSVRWQTHKGDVFGDVSAAAM